MALKLPESSHVKARLRRMLRPKSKLGRTTLWFAALALILEGLRLILRSANGTMLSGWSSFLTFVTVCCLLLLGVRYLRQHLMWRLRNRLIVTYVFIGVIPIILLVTMAGVAAYLFAGQFATYVANSDLQGQLQRLETSNTTLASRFEKLPKGNLNQKTAAEIAADSEGEFGQRTISVWDGSNSFIVDRSGVRKVPLSEPEALKGDYSGLVVDDNRLHLRTVKHLDRGGEHMTVISSVPITPELLKDSASRLGMVTIYPPDRAEPTATPVKLAADGSGKPAAAPAAKPKKPAPKTAASSNIVLDFGDTGSKVSLQGENTENRRQSVEAGQVPPAANRFDFEFPFVTGFSTVEWDTGKEGNGAIVVQTRPSMLYATLFSSLGKNAGIFLDVLTGIAIFFGVIELIALIIGVRLTRSVTKSVAELYGATQRVNRGELSHRIEVHSRDQMAALEQSFNSMMGSLAKLIAEQKEKQRLESELAIAHEVQELLFPRDLSGLERLEVHGVCQPARTVSGDYYDFIPMHHEKMVLAVGDISGKGISAALLMATVHAFVRAYSLEPEQTATALALGADVSSGMGSLRQDNSREIPGPSVLMATLNYQLFRSTPAAKYATMFLASYDARAQALTYSNAGHLPPFVIGADGRVIRLETSGTVVGLFDAMTYTESTVGMQPGDIFVAYSDGITEPENEFGEFGEERLIELVQQNHDQSLARISEVVTSAVKDWIAGAEQPDDITLVLARAR